MTDLRRLATAAACAWLSFAARRTHPAAAAAFRAPTRTSRNPLSSFSSSRSTCVRNVRRKEGPLAGHIFTNRPVLLLASAAANEPPVAGLESSYPEGTPPGLRGEAVRSALRSGRCIAYRWRHQPQPSPLDCGLVRIRGRGTRTFLHSKLTRSFVEDDGNRESSSSFRSACLLNGRGQVVDLVHVAVVVAAAPRSDNGNMEEATAFVLTSPGHASTELFNRLDPFVFPLDRVDLTDCSPAPIGASQHGGCYVFTVAAADRASVQELFDRILAPEIKKWMRTEEDDAFRIGLPAASETAAAAVFVPARAAAPPTGGDNATPSLLIVPHSHLPECAAVGYTFYLWDEDGGGIGGGASPAVGAGSSMWEKLMDDADGPIYVGPLEWEALRVEAGMPRYGREITGGLRSGANKKKNVKSALAETTGDSGDASDPASQTPSARITPASPLELHLEGTLDLEKGCYLGQEGVASVLKNPRGPPRALYQVVFEDEFNHYDGDVPDDDDETASSAETGDEKASAPLPGDNRTRPPAPGDALFVLGSNEEISAGTLTSVAEPGGTGEPVTVALALVPRADSILKRMADRGLAMRDGVTAAARDDNNAGPSRTLPLDGLEVIVGGTFTVGRLRSVPMLRYRQGENMFLDNPTDSIEEETQQWTPIQLEPDESESSIDDSVDPWESDASSFDAIDVTETDVPSKEADEAQAAALAEAKRKAEKLELLRKRAEEAMTKRRSKKSA